jgi:prepilin-type N-terminal cleavage/methylation domain-containing protein
VAYTKRSNQGGFTLIEVIVAIAVVAILAGIITPSVIKHLDDSKRARAQNDCLVIGSSIANFYKDVGRMPNMNAAGNAGITLLVGTGNTPTLGAGIGTWNAATTGATTDLLSNHLIDDQPKGQTGNIYPQTAGAELTWRGPYLSSFPSDPWGNRYAVNIGSAVTWVLSAGPNGQVQTAFNPVVAAGTVPTAGGDDIVYRIK